jgi:hypothetical protein
MATGAYVALFGCAVPAQPPRCTEAHEASCQRREKLRAHSHVGVRCAHKLVIRSTFIAGFPGETEEEFEHLLQLRA